MSLTHGQLPNDQSDFRLRSIALSAYGPSTLAAVGYGAVLPVLPLLARDLGASVQLAALVIGLAGLGPLFASLPAGALVGRIGERRALVLAGVVDAAAMLAATRAGDLTVLIVAVVVSGVAWTVFLLARQGFMIEVVPVSLRARALSTLGGTHRIGILVGPLLGALLIERWGLRAPFVLAALASLAAAAVALTMPDLGAAARSARPAISVVSVLTRHRYLLATLGSSVVVIAATRGVRGALLPLWAEHVGLSPQTTSLIFGVSVAVELTLFYPAGWVMDTFGRVWVAVPCVALMAAGFALLPLARSFAGVLAVAVLVGVGNGLGSGIVMTLGADAAPAEGRSQFLGAWRTCGELGSSAGPFLLAGLAAVLPLAGAAALTGAIMLAGAGWVGYWVGKRLV